LSAKILHVDVGAQPDVIGEIPALMVGIFIDHDVVSVPVPVIDESQVKGGDAEVEATKPEAARASSCDAPGMSTAEAAVKVAMLPGMIEVEAGIVAPASVSDPFAVVVNVRRVGMAFPVAKSGGRLGQRAMRGRRTVFRNIPAAYGVAATTSVATVLREGRDGKNQR